jgi:hypothetical protein
MPAPEYPVRCFLCNELTEQAFDLGADPIGVLIGENHVRFFAHQECMRKVASPAFPFPSQEELDEEGRELAAEWRAELEAEKQSEH